MLELRHCVLDPSEKGSGNECEQGCFVNVICLFIFVKISLFLSVSESDLAT